MSKTTEAIAQVTEELPEVQEHVVEAAEADAKQKAKSAPMDDFGHAFDSKQHAVGTDGEPRVNKDGTFRKKRQPKGSSITMPGTTPGDMSIKVGKQIAETIFQLGQLFGGEEWAPQKNEEYGTDERRQMHDAWTAYCEAKDMQDFPPGVAVSIAMLGYVVPRFFMPKTKSRFEVAKDWVSEKWLSMRRKRRGKLPPEAEAAE